MSAEHPVHTAMEPHAFVPCSHADEHCYWCGGDRREHEETEGGEG